MSLRGRPGLTFGPVGELLLLGNQLSLTSDVLEETSKQLSDEDEEAAGSPHQRHHTPASFIKSINIRTLSFIMQYLSYINLSKLRTECNIIQ